MESQQAYQTLLRFEEWISNCAERKHEFQVQQTHRYQTNVYQRSSQQRGVRNHFIRGIRNLPSDGMTKPFGKKKVSRDPRCIEWE